MTDDTFTSVDTITMAAILSALQVVIDAYRVHQPDPAALQALEAQAVARIKALDTGDFTYEEQAEGLAEGLMLTRSMFRSALAGPTVQADHSAPAPAPAPAAEAPAKVRQLHRH